MSNSKKVLLVGWDAADWKVIHPLVDRGMMPNVARLIQNGTIGNLRTLQPPLSPMLWTSVATGKRPYKHGIYGFTEPTPDGRSVQPITNASRRCKALWNILNQHDMRSLVVGWWPSHPAEPINGAMVSDMFHKAPKKPGEAWDLRGRTIHPPERTEELAEFRVHPMEIPVESMAFFIPDLKDVDQSTDPRLSMALRTMAECTSIHAVTTHLLEHDEWDFAAVYYDAIDHFSHGFMKYHPPQQETISDEDFRLYKNVVNAGYVYHDMMLGRLLEFTDDDTTVILISDHGFHPDHLRPKALPSEPAGPAAEHRDYGIFIASGPGIRKDHIIHGANLLDIAPTVLQLYGMPIGEDMDGQLLDEIFETPPDVKTIPSWEDVDGDDGQLDASMAMTAEESQAALDQLVALGYIEKPDADSDKAVAQSVRELNYNLARAYIDADMYGDAMPLLLELYNDYPLEFRFGVQLANCLRTMNRTPDLKLLVEDLNNRWRVAAEAAKAELREVAELAKTRRTQWLEMKRVDDSHKDDPSAPPPLARRDMRGRPVLFSEAENRSIQQLRAIAQGNPHTLDVLGAIIATAEQDFEQALEYLGKASEAERATPGMQYQLGMTYLGLKRFEDAAEAFERALALDESSPGALMGMCRTCVETGKFDEAIDFGNRAIGLQYQFPLAHYFLGCAKAGIGDKDGAIASFETALGQNPNFQQAHDRLALIQGAKGDQERSAHHAQAAKELAAQNSADFTVHEPIELPKIDAETFRAQLPKVGSEQNTDEFLRCLAQPKLEQPAAHASKDAEEIVIVSGLPRSGTSMMMQMLTAAGIRPYTDEERVADENNPKGYYEADLVKQLMRKNDWLDQCGGQALKVVAPLIPYLPQGHRYRVVFMERDMDEILGSQRTMLDRLDEQGAADDDREHLATVFGQQAAYASNLLDLHGFPVLRVGHRQVIEDPAAVAGQLAEFLGRDVDIAAVAATVDPSLYRQKSGDSA